MPETKFTETRALECVLADDDEGLAQILDGMTETELAHLASACRYLGTEAMDVWARKRNTDRIQGTVAPAAD